MVHGWLRLLRPVTPTGSQPPFSAGQRWNPSPLYYRVAFASSRIPYRLRRSPRLRAGDSRDLRLARPQRANPAYHVPRFVPPKGLRMPLYTGGYYAWVGRPLKPAEPHPRPILGLEPLSRLSSAGVTVRNSEASLSLSISLILRSRSPARLGFLTPAACLRPHRYQ